MKACLIAIFTLFGAAAVAACECAERPTVPEAYEASAYVVILALKSVEDDLAVLTVGVALKGDLKHDEELVFQQSAGKDCKWRFQKKDINKLFLFFLDKRPEKGLWQASTCSPSKYAGEAKDLPRFRELDKLQRPPKELRLTDEPRPAAKPPRWTVG